MYLESWEAEIVRTEDLNSRLGRNSTERDVVPRQSSDDVTVRMKEASVLRSLVVLADSRGRRGDCSETQWQKPRTLQKSKPKALLTVYYQEHFRR